MAGLASVLALAISLLRHSQVEKLSKKRKVSAKTCRVSQVYAELPPFGPPIFLLKYGKIAQVWKDLSSTEILRPTDCTRVSRVRRSLKYEDSNVGIGQ
jgi:hypothetical protein